MDSEIATPLLSPKTVFSKLSTVRLILITFLQMGLNVVQSAFGVITLPYEMKGNCDVYFSKFKNYFLKDLLWLWESFLQRRLLL